MTNAEKYLKEGTNTRELWVAFQEYYYKNKDKESDVAKACEHFFKQPIKPTLTEDERVILRNIPKEYTKIRRNEWQEIEFVQNDSRYRTCYLLSHLFQFIKERRRIRDTRVARR